MKAILSAALWTVIAVVAGGGAFLIATNTPPERPRQSIPPNPILTEPRVSAHWPKPLPSDGAPPAQRWTGKEGVGVLGDVNHR